MEKLKHGSVFTVSAWCFCNDCLSCVKPQAMLSLHCLAQDLLKIRSHFWQTSFAWRHPGGRYEKVLPDDGWRPGRSGHYHLWTMIENIPFVTWKYQMSVLRFASYCSCQGAPDGIYCTLCYFWDFRVSSLGKKIGRAWTLPFLKHLLFRHQLSRMLASATFYYLPVSAEPGNSCQLIYMQMKTSFKVDYRQLLF